MPKLSCFSKGKEGVFILKLQDLIKEIQTRPNDFVTIEGGNYGFNLSETDLEVLTNLLLENKTTENVEFFARTMTSSMVKNICDLLSVNTTIGVVAFEYTNIDPEDQQALFSAIKYNFTLREVHFPQRLEWMRLREIHDHIFVNRFKFEQINLASSKSRTEVLEHLDLNRKSGKIDTEGFTNQEVMEIFERLDFFSLMIKLNLPVHLFKDGDKFLTSSHTGLLRFENGLSIYASPFEDTSTEDQSNTEQNTEIKFT
jgi:hypothetical protein